MSGYRLKRDTVDMVPIASTGTITSVSRPHTGHTEMINLQNKQCNKRKSYSIAIQPNLDVGDSIICVLIG